MYSCVVFSDSLELGRYGPEWQEQFEYTSGRDVYQGVALKYIESLYIVNNTIILSPTNTIDFLGKEQARSISSFHTAASVTVTVAEDCE